MVHGGRGLSERGERCDGGELRCGLCVGVRRRVAVTGVAMGPRRLCAGLGPALGWRRLRRSCLERPASGPLRGVLEWSGGRAPQRARATVGSAGNTIERQRFLGRAGGRTELAALTRVRPGRRRLQGG